MVDGQPWATPWQSGLITTIQTCGPAKKSHHHRTDPRASLDPDEPEAAPGRSNPALADFRRSSRWPVRSWLEARRHRNRLAHGLRELSGRRGYVLLCERATVRLS